MIGVNQFKLLDKDVKAVSRAVKTGWISSAGPEILKFEKKFSKLIGKKYCSTVSSGTAALEIALKTINLKEKDEVIIPNFTIFSSAMSVIKNKAIPVLIDCDLITWNMKIEDLEKKITSKTKAIIATHIYGYPIEIDKIKKICKKKKITLIEDAAEMLGHEYKKKKCGFFGDISIFSLYANKHITTGEGGLILTNSRKYNDKFKNLRNLCFGKINRYNHDDIGWNYRFTNIQAALGLSQLSRLKKIIKKKKEIGKIYYNQLKNNKLIYIQKPKLNKLENVYWVVGILIKNKRFKAKIFRSKLKKMGIETREFFWPINKQKILKKLNYKFSGSYNNSEYLSDYGFYLPSGINTTKSEIIYICNSINIISNKLLKL